MKNQQRENDKKRINGKQSNTTLSEVYWLTQYIRNQIRTSSWLRTENNIKYIAETKF